jgi:hypothetical protein
LVGSLVFPQPDTNRPTQDVVSRPSQIGNLGDELAWFNPDGSLSLRVIAAKLTAEGLQKPAGATVWAAATVATVEPRWQRARLGVFPGHPFAARCDGRNGASEDLREY